MFTKSLAYGPMIGLFLFFTLLAQLSPASAIELPPDEVAVTTQVYFPDNGHDFREGVYTYDISWQGIPAAQADVTVKRGADIYEVFVAAKTNNFVDVFYKLRYTAAGSLSAQDFSPGYLFIDQRENSKVTKAALEFSEDGRIRSLLTKSRTSGDKVREYNFELNNYTLEPLSAAFLARSLDWSPGVEREFDTFDGKSRYLIRLKCLEEVEVAVNDLKRPVWVVEPKITNLTKQEENKKLRRAYLYVTADKYRDVLQIKSEVFVGSVSTKLVQFRPASEQPVQLARVIGE